MDWKELEQAGRSLDVPNGASAELASATREQGVGYRHRWASVIPGNTSITVGIGRMPERLAHSLARALMSEPRCEFFGAITSAESQGAGPPRDGTPDVLVVARAGDGEEAEIVRLAHSHPDSTIIALADLDQAGTLRLLREVGVHACLAINVPAEDIVAALPCLHASARKVWLTLRGGRTRDLRPLTKREQEVLGLLRRGFTNPQIASMLCISRETAKDHVSNILAKLGADSRRQLLVARQERSGQVDESARVPMGRG